LNISCDELFIINQHKFLVFCLECIMLQMFMKKFIHIFIHKYHSSMIHGRIFFHVTKYFVLGVTKYTLNIPSMWEEYSKKYLVVFPCSCSLVHAHVFTLMLAGSWNNIPLFNRKCELEIMVTNPMHSSPTLAIWIARAIQEHCHATNIADDPDVVALSMPPNTIAWSYKKIKAYGSHFCVDDSSTIGTMTYDSGVATFF
jgi:hypothetical protein